MCAGVCTRSGSRINGNNLALNCNNLSLHAAQYVSPSSTSAQILAAKLRLNDKMQTEGQKLPCAAGQKTTINMTLTLGLPFGTAGEEHSMERKVFVDDLSNDLANASGLPPVNFCIMRLMPGSIVIVDVKISAQDAERVARDLERQANDTESALRSGSITCFTEAIEVEKRDFGGEGATTHLKNDLGGEGAMTHLKNDLEGPLETAQAEAGMVKSRAEDLDRTLDETTKAGNAVCVTNAELRDLRQNSSLVSIGQDYDSYIRQPLQATQRKAKMAEFQNDIQRAVKLENVLETPPQENMEKQKTINDLRDHSKELTVAQQRNDEALDETCNQLSGMSEIKGVYNSFENVWAHTHTHEMAKTLQESQDQVIKSCILLIVFTSHKHHNSILILCKEITVKNNTTQCRKR